MRLKLLLCFMVTILNFSNFSWSLKVYHSLLPVDSDSGLAGLHYLKQNQSVSFTNSLTYCLRFKYQKLGEQAFIWYIGAPGSWVYLMKLSAAYPATWFHFGPTYQDMGYSNWILKDPIKNQFDIWYTNKWQHLCIAYDNVNNSLTITKVNKNTFFAIAEI